MTGVSLGLGFSESLPKNADRENSRTDRGENYKHTKRTNEAKQEEEQTKNRCCFP
jgi:hypothetical protein